jgi:hypothetical protein
MLYLQTMPEVVRGIGGKDILNSDIAIDEEIAGRLRQI